MTNLLRQYWQPLDLPFQDSIGRLLMSVILLFLLIFLRRVLIKVIPDHRKHLSKEWASNLKTLVLALGILGLIIIWLPHLHNFFTIFSIIGTGLIIVNKEPVLNLTGWVYIMFRRPFDIGNRVMIQDIIGDVIDIRLFEFSMMEVKSREEGGQSTGRVIRIPNSLLFSYPLANASKEFSLYWNEIPVVITKTSNWEKAMEIIYKIAEQSLDERKSADEELKKALNRYSIHFAQTKPKVYVEVRDSSILLTLRHLSRPRKTRDITHVFWTKLLKRFAAESDIELV